MYHRLWSDTTGNCGRKLIISFAADAGITFKSIETTRVIFGDVSLTKAICPQVIVNGV
jgi:hypothetical protein